MNKVIIGLILAVCVLGMALVMLNERLGRKSDSQQLSPSTQSLAENRSRPQPMAPDVDSVDVTPRTIEKETAPTTEDVFGNEDAARKALVMERAEAEEALAPPKIPAIRDEPKPQDTPQAVKPRETPTPKPVVKAENPAPKPEAQEVKPAPPAPKPAAKAPDSVKPKAENASPARQDKAAGKTINRYVIYAREKGATLRIGGTSPITFNHMTLENPDRVVVDMDGDWQFPVNPGIPKNDLVNNVRIGKMGDKTRVVIDLKMKPRTVRVLPGKNGDSFDVRVDK